MKRTISVKCSRCGYIRYDVIHLDNECGGLLFKNDSGMVTCALCGEDMSYHVMLTCPSCGCKRPVDPINLETNINYQIVAMEVFETIIITS